VKNFLASFRATLTKKKGWWEQTFLFWRMLSSLRSLEEMVNLMNYEIQKYAHMKKTIRNLLFRSGKIFYSLAVKNGESKNHRLEKIFYSLSKLSFETRWLLYGF